jgi:hypothetical protein
MSFSKDKDTSVNDLERILMFTEENKTVRKSVLETYKTLRDIAEDCYNRTYDFFHPHKEKGLTVYLNHAKNSPLKINGKSATYVDENYSIYDKEGKKFLKSLLGEDGAVEITPEGRINSYRRMFQSQPDEVAAERGIVKPGEEVSSSELGFKRKVFTRHMYAMAATGRDPQLYVITLSEETGDITVMHDYEIIFSTMADEIPERLAKLYLNPTGRLYHERTRTPSYLPKEFRQEFSTFNPCAHCTFF